MYHISNTVLAKFIKPLNSNFINLKPYFCINHMKDITYTNLINSSLPHDKPDKKQGPFGAPKNKQNDRNIFISSDEVYKRLYQSHNEKRVIYQLKSNAQNNIFTDKENIDPEANYKIHDNFNTQLADSNPLCNLSYTSLYLQPSFQKLANSVDQRFRINVHSILNRSDTRTTCMVKNIPNKYTQSMLIDLLNEHHYGCFDFVYLRMDFKNKCNVGYAFVNFTNYIYVAEFYVKISNMKWKNFSSNKIAELTYASVQGYDNLVGKFRNSVVMKERLSYRPKVFYRDRRLKGEENPEGI